MNHVKTANKVLMLNDLAIGMHPGAEHHLVKWQNPLETEQRVLISYSERKGPKGGYIRESALLVWAPRGQQGDVLELDEVWSSAIQVVRCQEDECINAPGGGGWCKNPEHAGVVMGGSAPLLRRLGRTNVTVNGPISAETIAKDRENEKAHTSIGGVLLPSAFQPRRP